MKTKLSTGNLQARQPTPRTLIPQPQPRLASVREDGEEAEAVDQSPESITADQFKSIQSENEALKGETAKLNEEIQSLKGEIDSLSAMYDAAVNSALSSNLAVAKDEGSTEVQKEKSALTAEIRVLEGRYEEAVAALKVSRTIKHTSPNPPKHKHSALNSERNVEPQTPKP